MANKNIQIVKLSEDYQFKPFDCGDADLNEFLSEDAKLYLRRLLSVTYIMESDTDIMAYFSLSNDKISIPESDKATWRKIKRLFPYSKHRSDYPAIKIGRLGVSKLYQGQHIGTDIINFVKAMFLTNSRTGCAFVTVDALQCAVPFYLKNGFKPLNQTLMTDTSQVTVPLYYDLSQLL